MPTSIPYDPSLALGNVVAPAHLKVLLDIAKLNADIEAAQENLNSLLELRRSLQLTMQEVGDLGIDTAALAAKLVEVNASILASVKAYADIRVENETKIQPLRAQICTVNESIESPVDFNRSKIMPLPLSADSLSLNVQYFKFDENIQTANQTMKAIKGFVTEAASFWGESEASSLASTVTKQINSQRQNHNIEGTLIIAASCTHQQAQLLAPFILDPDKAIRVWNAVYGTSLRMNPADEPTMRRIAGEPDQKVTLDLLSGATFGSSFIGMVHMKHRETLVSNQAMGNTDVTAQVQAASDIELFGQSLGASFNFGAGGENDAATDVKSLLSRVDVNSHVSLVTRGVIPSIKANDTKYAIQSFADDDWKNMGAKLATLQNEGQGEMTSMAATAAAARNGQTMVALESAKVTNALTALASTDSENNKVLDLNSLMTAFENYIDAIGAGKVGLPITYYIKPLQRSQLAQMWGNKYFPGKYVQLSSDDAGTGHAANQAPAGAPPADGSTST